MKLITTNKKITSSRSIVSSLSSVFSFAIAFLLTLSFALAPLQFVFAESMSSGNYKIQADSMNFEGDRSTSASYNLEDTGGEVGTGDLQSANSILHAGFLQASTSSSTSPTNPPVTPPSNSTGGAQGTSGSYAVNVVNFVANPTQKDIDLSWGYPTDSNIASVRIVRSLNFFPSDINDGEVIFEGSASGATGEVIDHDVIPGALYYYAIFAQNSFGQYSSGVLAQARIVPQGEIIPPVTSGEIFNNIPNATHVDQQIANLTLLDFDFIQDGRKIEHAGGIVPIDGKKNLTIQLAYNKVPEILKTIAITLTDPTDNTKFFTFLLRVNKDKTVYEATIAPLGKSGEYKLNAIILDYKNQGLKRLQGSLRALVLDEGQSFFGFDGKSPARLYMTIVFLVLAFLAILLLILLERRKKDKKEKEAEEKAQRDAQARARGENVDTIPPYNLPQ